jgi:hypothetical protein
MVNGATIKMRRPRDCIGEQVIADFPRRILVVVAYFYQLRSFRHKSLKRSLLHTVKPFRDGLRNWVRAKFVGYHSYIYLVTSFIFLLAFHY